MIAGILGGFFALVFTTVVFFFGYAKGAATAHEGAHAEKMLRRMKMWKAIHDESNFTPEHVKFLRNMEKLVDEDIAAIERGR